MQIDWGVVGEVLSGLGTVTIAISAVLATLHYRYQVDLERMKWVQHLYDRFYESERHKGIRQLIDFDNTPTDRF